MKKSVDKFSLGIGIVLGCSLMFNLGLSSPQEKVASNQYHLVILGANSYVYNSTTGDFKFVRQRELNNNGNLIQLLRK